VEAPIADPEAARAFLLHAGEPAGRLATGGTEPRVTALALENTARGEANGMQPRGPVALAMLREGERATLTVSLEPNECATFIAQGGLGAIEVDLFLTTGSGSDTKIIAEDPTSGPIAIIGGRGGCFRNGRGRVSAELQARMRRGGGAVLVRGYAGPPKGNAFPTQPAPPRGR
jgi:hypothetical protein